MASTRWDGLSIQSLPAFWMPIRDRDVPAPLSALWIAEVSPGRAARMEGRLAERRSTEVVAVSPGATIDDRAGQNVGPIDLPPRPGYDSSQRNHAVVAMPSLRNSSDLFHYRYLQRREVGGPPVRPDCISKPLLGMYWGAWKKQIQLRESWSRSHQLQSDVIPRGPRTASADAVPPTEPLSSRVRVRV